ncbi:hypothetical protein CAOG_06097 [Capsaspora owczarzaki ATCC 30864]|uniref:hypothetical protein n=1 Tax=Capsaspora owczarzaki (strain ATCC 30864) TaxID=595528 RepID=UPI000352222A|nr:hypothetical protein CAOG_06097 [Capsaspora owczarzaki ATCC 30864]|eukprot:XP_004345687.2 hypothetical protein CAOG_06097 [Capsaspora owczarzaki ATCC 30864]
MRTTMPMLWALIAALAVVALPLAQHARAAECMCNDQDFRCSTNWVTNCANSWAQCDNGYTSIKTGSKCTITKSTYYCFPNTNPACCAGYATTTCTACVAGYQCPGGTNGPTSACVAGTYSGAKAATCSQCAVNTYQAVAAQTSCINCPSDSSTLSLQGKTFCTCSEGYYAGSLGTNSMTCTKCETGYSCSNNVRTICPVGYVQPTMGQPSCLPCAPGSYQPSTGQTTCINTVAGQYQDQQGQSGFKTCPAGTMQPSNGPASSCTNCTVGNYQDQPASANCKPCPASSTSTPRASLCTCNSGYYMSGGNCVPCEIGYRCPGDNSRYACQTNQFQNMTQQASCKPCPSDSTSSAGASVCACSSGRYLSSDWLCAACPAGSSCLENVRTPCIAGKYQNTTLQSSCKTCPSYSTSSEGSTLCTCSAGRYSAGFDACPACQPGYMCPGDNSRSACAINTYQANPTQSACVPCTSNSASPAAAVTCACSTGYREAGSGDSLTCTQLGAISVAEASQSLVAASGDTVTLTFDSTSFNFNASCIVSVDTTTSTAHAGVHYIIQSSLNLTFSNETGNVATITIVIPTTSAERSGADLYLTISSVSLALLGSSKTAHIAIQGANLPGGLIQFAADSRSLVIDGYSSSTVALKVERLQAAAGTATFFICESSTGACASFDFAAAQVLATVSVAIPQPFEPSLARQLSFVIVNVTSSTSADVGGYSTAILTVRETWDAHGVFSFSSASYNCTEAAGLVDVVISRSRGLFGTVQVNIGTLLYPSGLANSDDFVAPSNPVIFGDGINEVAVSIGIVADGIPEVDESFSVVLSQPANGASLSTALPTTATVTIAQNDDANGVIQLQQAAYTTSESAGQVLLTAVRSAGSFGSVSFTVSTTAGSATAGSDFQPLASSVFTMGPGVTTVSIPVTIINDAVPELDETFKVTINHEVTGGARVGALTEATVTISQNDDAHGLFAFAGEDGLVSSDPRVVTSGSSFVVAVARLGGLYGSVSVRLQTDFAYPGEATSADVSVDRVLTFAEGESLQNVTISVALPASARPAYRFNLVLGTSTGGASIQLSAAQSYFKIDAYSSVGGVVRFVSSDYSADEGSITTLTVERVPADASSTETLTVQFRANFAAEGPSSASAADVSTVDGTLSFAPGQSTATIDISAVQDDIPELAELFDVELYNPQTGLFVSESGSVATVTISENDNAAGVVAFAERSLKAFDSAGQVAIEIVRTRGLLRAVTVTVVALSAPVFPSDMPASKQPKPAIPGVDFYNATLEHVAVLSAGSKPHNHDHPRLPQRIIQSPSERFRWRLSMFPAALR